jgi:hypothetical protein
MSKLTWSHYTISPSLKPLAVCPTEAISFDSDEFINNAINKVIEEKYQ